jgi:hypothetical protein
MTTSIRNLSHALRTLAMEHALALRAAAKAELLTTQRRAELRALYAAPVAATRGDERRALVAGRRIAFSH